MVKGLDDIFDGIFRTATKNSVDDVLSSNAVRKPIGDMFSTLGEKVKKILPNKNIIPPLPIPKPINKKLISSDQVAKKLGFKNEGDFFEYINQFERVGKRDNRAKKLFTVLRKNKKVIATVGVAASIPVLYNYCKRHQEINSGCFRYRKNKNGGYLEKTRKKMGGNYCLSSNIGAKIKQETHPLFNVETWDCNFNGFEKEEKVIDILDLGCRGLCSVENFNNLAGGEYKPVQNQDHPYIYRCEKVTILQSLTDYTGDAIDEIIAGALNSDLGHRFKTLFDFSKLKIYILICIFLFLYYNFLGKKETIIEKNNG